MNRYTVPAWIATSVAGVWVGMLILLGVGVAPVIFKFMESKTQAGLLNGIILRRMNIIEAVCGLILLSVFLYLFLRKKDRLRGVQLIGILLVLINLTYYSAIITPRMETLKQTIQNFDVPRSEDKRPEREEFDLLHKQYSSLVTVNIILLLVLSFMASHTVKQDEI